MADAQTWGSAGLLYLVVPSGKAEEGGAAIVEFIWLHENYMKVKTISATVRAVCPHFAAGKSPLSFALKSVTPKVTQAPASQPSNAADPLDFVEATKDDAIQRINTEYFFRRDTSEICRQDTASGEIQVLTQQQLKTALAGRWVEAVDHRTGKTKVRDAATVWLESRKRREVYGVQYCPNNVGLPQGCLNLWLGWGIQPGPGDCSIVLDHIRQVIASGNVQKAEFILNWSASLRHVRPRGSKEDPKFARSSERPR